MSAEYAGLLAMPRVRAVSRQRANDDRWSAETLAFLRLFFGSEFAREFSIHLWNGTEIPAAQAGRFVLFINDPSALRAAFLPPLDLNPGRAFVERHLDVLGDLEAAADTIFRAFDRIPPTQLIVLTTRLLRLPKPQLIPIQAQSNVCLRGAAHSKNRDAAAITFHYDLPHAFFRTFLDASMTYSCGYFEDDASTIEAAQEAKIDYVLRKLRLRPGETLLDIGCGWGSLVLRAAQSFGALAFGITLSREQAKEAELRIARAGLGERAKIQTRDYRDLGGMRFDKIVSVGMVEHVGREQLATYMETVYRALRPGGLFLNQGIAHLDRGRRDRASGFIARYIFPEGDLLPINNIVTSAERAGFEIRDIENLRMHYARTLRCWLRNLENRRDAAIEETSEQIYRAWRLYLAGCAQGFARGRMALFQTLLAKPQPLGKVDAPETRYDLYR